MRLIFLLLVVSFCVVAAKYLPDDTTASSALLWREKRSNSEESSITAEQDSDDSNEDDDENDSNESNTTDSVEKQRQKEIERQQKLKRKLEEEERKKQEKLAKEEQKQMEKEEKQRRKIEEEQRKVQEKLEKEERKRIEKLEKEKRKQEEKIRKEIEKATNPTLIESVESEEDNEDSIDLEDIWKGYVYDKYNITVNSTNIEKQAAINSYLQNELGLTANSTKAERHQAALSIIQNNLHNGTTATNSFKAYLRSHVNAVLIQDLQARLESKIEELNNKTLLLNNTTLPGATVAQQQLEEKRTLLQAAVQYISTWFNGQASSNQSNSNTPGSSSDTTAGNIGISGTGISTTGASTPGASTTVADTAVIGATDTNVSAPGATVSQDGVGNKGVETGGIAPSSTSDVASPVDIVTSVGASAVSVSDTVATVTSGVSASVSPDTSLPEVIVPIAGHTKVEASASIPVSNIAVASSVSNADIATPSVSPGDATNIISAGENMHIPVVVPDASVIGFSNSDTTGTGVSASESVISGNNIIPAVTDAIKVSILDTTVIEDTSAGVYSSGTQNTNAIKTVISGVETTEKIPSGSAGAPQSVVPGTSAVEFNAENVSSTATDIQTTEVVSNVASATPVHIDALSMDSIAVSANTSYPGVYTSDINLASVDDVSTGSGNIVPEALAPAQAQGMPGPNAPTLEASSSDGNVISNTNTSEVSITGTDIQSETTPEVVEIGVNVPNTDLTDLGGSESGTPTINITNDANTKEIVILDSGTNTQTASEPVVTNTVTTGKNSSDISPNEVIISGTGTDGTGSHTIETAPVASGSTVISTGNENTPVENSNANPINAVAPVVSDSIVSSPGVSGGDKTDVPTAEIFSSSTEASVVNENTPVEASNTNKSAVVASTNEATVLGVLDAITSDTVIYNADASNSDNIPNVSAPSFISANVSATEVAIPETSGVIDTNVNTNVPPGAPETIVLESNVAGTGLPEGNDKNIESPVHTIQPEVVVSNTSSVDVTKGETIDTTIIATSTEGTISLDKSQVGIDKVTNAPVSKSDVDVSASMVDTSNMNNLSTSEISTSDNVSNITVSSVVTNTPVTGNTDAVIAETGASDVSAMSKVTSTVSETPVSGSTTSDFVLTESSSKVSNTNEVTVGPATTGNAIPIEGQRVTQSLGTSDALVSGSEQTTTESALFLSDIILPAEAGASVVDITTKQ